MNLIGTTLESALLLNLKPFTHLLSFKASLNNIPLNSVLPWLQSNIHLRELDLFHCSSLSYGNLLSAALSQLAHLESLHLNNVNARHFYNSNNKKDNQNSFDLGIALQNNKQVLKHLTIEGPTQILSLIHI